MAGIPIARKKTMQDNKVAEHIAQSADRFAGQIKDTTEKVAGQFKDTSGKVAGQFKDTSKKVAKAVRAKVQRHDMKMPWYVFLTAVPAVVLVYLLVRKNRRDDRFAPGMIPATGRGTSGSSWGPGAPEGTSPMSTQAGVVQRSSRAQGFAQSISQFGSQETAEDLSPGEQTMQSQPYQHSAPGDTAQKPDDLVMVEGIGPKISRLLADEGIRTFNDLAEADPTHLERILRDNNLYFANPSTWPAQARMIANGEWERFNELRNQLSAGKPKDMREE